MKTVTKKKKKKNISKRAREKKVKKEKHFNAVIRSFIGDLFVYLVGYTKIKA